MYFTPQLQVRAYLLPWTSRAPGSCKLNLILILLLVVYPQSSSFSKCQEVSTLVVLNACLRSTHKVGHNVLLKETNSIKYFLKWSCPVTYAQANLRLALLSLSRDLACELLGALTSVSLEFYQEKVSICVYVIFWTQFCNGLLAVDHSILQSGSGPVKEVLTLSGSSCSAFWFPSNLLCPGTHLKSLR